MVVSVSFAKSCNTYLCTCRLDLPWGKSQKQEDSFQAFRVYLYELRPLTAYWFHPFRRGHRQFCDRFFANDSSTIVCLLTESHLGREDWHPLKTKSVGLGFAFDGARYLHYTLENTTQRTRVSVDFRFAIYRQRSASAIDNWSLCIYYLIVVTYKKGRNPEAYIKKGKIEFCLHAVPIAVSFIGATTILSMNALIKS